MLTCNIFMLICEEIQVACQHKKNIFNVIMKKLHNNMNKLHIIIKSVAHQQHKIIEL